MGFDRRSGTVWLGARCFRRRGRLAAQFGNIEHGRGRLPPRRKEIVTGLPASARSPGPSHHVRGIALVGSVMTSDDAMRAGRHLVGCDVGRARFDPCGFPDRGCVPGRARARVCFDPARGALRGNRQFHRNPDDHPPSSARSPSQDCCPSGDRRYGSGVLAADVVTAHLGAPTSVEPRPVAMPWRGASRPAGATRQRLSHRRLSPTRRSTSSP